MEKKWWVPYILAGICLGIGTFFDYQIDAFLYHPNGMYGIVFERYILWLFIVAVTFVFTMLRRVHQQIIFVIPEIISAFYAVVEVGKYLIPFREHWLLFVFLACAVIAFCNMIVYAMPISQLERIEKKGIFYVCVLVTAIVITFLLKNIWGRVRFRDLQTVREFTHWYLPQGFRGHYSFPSGHMTTATSIVSLLVIRKQNRQQKPPLYIGVVVYGFILCMGVARMLMGAHYLSDVAAGFIIAYTVFLGYRMYFNRKRYL